MLKELTVAAIYYYLAVNKEINQGQSRHLHGRKCEVLFSTNECTLLKCLPKAIFVKGMIQKCGVRFLWLQIFPVLARKVTLDNLALKHCTSSV